MRLPRISIISVFLREVFSKRTLMREPEPALIMDGDQESLAFNQAGESSGALGAFYVFNLAHATQTIQGCRKVIDLGCGPGNQLVLLAQLHPETEFVGLDLSEVMLNFAREKVKLLGLKNITFENMDISTLERIDDASVDGVISTFAIHHLPSRKHLDQLFYHTKRVLKRNGAIYLFDFGRLKSLQSVMYFAYRDRKNLPYLFSLDFERSLRAAFMLEDFQELAEKYFGHTVQVIGTFKAPLLIMIKTPERKVSDLIVQQIREERLKLEPRYRDDVDDARVFFKLSGIKNDLFGSFLPGSDIQANLRMIRLTELEVQVRIYVRRTTRFAIIAMMICRLALRMGLYYLAQTFLSKTKVKYFKQVTFMKMGRISYNTLSHLKGPVMKLGQMFSYLPIGLPLEITQQLEPLQDFVAPLAGFVIRSIVEKELGRPIAEIFSDWRDTPLASASISQLHYARLLNGQSVVVKVKYPKMSQIIESDLKNIQLLTPLLTKKTGLTNIKELLHELKSLIEDECNFIQAAKFQEEFRSYFSEDPEIIIPKVYQQFSTSEVLTMDYVDGQNYAEFKKSSTQDEKNKAAQIIWKFAGISMNKYCLYNADPHPGNYLFLDGKVCFLDFGFTKRYSPEFMNNWKEQTLAGRTGDLEGFKSANLKLGYVENEKAFDHEKMMKAYQDVLYAPWSQDRLYKFNQDFINTEFKTLTELLQNQSGNRMPVEFLSILRLLWGQHAILADLQAEGNWHQIVFPYILEKNKTS